MHKFKPHYVSVDGISVLEKNKVLLEEELAVGDVVDVFYLPNGQYLLTKNNKPDSRSMTVEQITASYIYFEEELRIQED